MFAVVIRFLLEPDSQWEADHMADIVFKFAHEKQGFIDLIPMGQHETGDYKWIFLWKKKEFAMHTLNTWYDPFMKLLGDYGHSNRPYAEWFEVQDLGGKRCDL